MTGPGSLKHRFAAAWRAIPVAGLLLGPGGRTDDWPQFLGPNGDGISSETGLIDSWPTNGPPRRWTKKVGSGYSAPSILGNRLVLHHRDGGEEIVECFEAGSGRSLWRYAYPSAFIDPYGYNNGPRATPLLKANRCYTFGAEGRLLCLELDTGRKIWSRDTSREFKIPTAFFGVGSSPIMEGNRLIVMVGGQPNAGVVAFDPAQGRTLWKSVGQDNWEGQPMLGWPGERTVVWRELDKQASYSTPVAATLAGQRVVFCLMRQGLVALDPTNGRVHFSRWFRARVEESVNAASPVVVGDRLFFSAAYYHVGSVLLRVHPEGFDELWQGTALETHWNTPIHHNGYLYAFSGRNEPDARFRCVELASGKLMWDRDESWRHTTRQPASYGRGSAILADHQLIVLGEGGLLGRFGLDPEKPQERRPFQVPDLFFPCWTAPVPEQSQALSPQRKPPDLPGSIGKMKPPPIKRTCCLSRSGRCAGVPWLAVNHAIVWHRLYFVLLVVATSAPTSADTSPMPPPIICERLRPERQITHNRGGHILTNIGVWSPDSQWIVYDTRSDAEGTIFDGVTIEVVHVRTPETRVLYRASRHANCGVATFNPVRPEVVFILGPENPTVDWAYNAYHRRGVIVQLDQPQHAVNLDARDLLPPFTPGALRGGSHVHVFSGDGQWVSFTYEDHILAQFAQPGADHDLNQRNVGVCAPVQPVHVKSGSTRNRDGSYFSILVTQTRSIPRTGDIVRACEEGWIGTNGYLRADGQRQRRALAFQGTVLSRRGDLITEVFLVDLPEDITIPGTGPLAGTETRMPAPPRATSQRRLTDTEAREQPGLQGPRHWLRSSPDGEYIAFLMKDDDGVVQLWTISPRGGKPSQLTRNPWNIASSFTWSPDGRQISHVMDNSVFVTDLDSGLSTRLTARSDDESAPRPEACVFSPSGRQIAYIRRILDGDTRFNQIFVVSME